jgi:TRAP-type C4-dicarboxylate transport system permease small subunit
MNPIVSLSEGLVRVERVISRFMVVGFVALITVNVGMRYLAGRPIVFAEEIAAIMLVWLAFISVSISIHDRTQIGVTLLVDRLPPRPRVIVAQVVSVLVAFMLAVLLWKSITWVLSPNVGFEQVITTGWAKWPFFLVVPVWAATSLIHVLAQVTVPSAEHHEVTI